MQKTREEKGKDKDGNGNWEKKMEQVDGVVLSFFPFFSCLLNISTMAMNVYIITIKKKKIQY